MSDLELATPVKTPPTLRFEGGEHTAIGDDTLLRFVKDAPPIPARQVELCATTACCKAAVCPAR